MTEHNKNLSILTRRTFLGGAAGLGITISPLLSDNPVRAVLEPGQVLLTFLHTNDLHGRAYLPGQTTGLARLAPIVRQTRIEMPNVILLDGGDVIHGTPEEKAFAGRPLLSAMNALGYDAATVGNHEFDFGQKRTREAMDFARFPLLSANVVEEKTGKVWGGLKPYTIIERGGARIGVFGLTTPTTVSIEWPRTLAGIEFTDPIEAARRMVSHLRQTERVDVVIALSHLGYNPDRDLALVVAGIDVILGAHTHTVLPQQVWVNNALIVQTGCYGAFLSRVDMVVLKSGKKMEAGRVIAINGKGEQWWGQGQIAAPLGKHYPSGPLLPPASVEDAAVVAAYRPFLEPMQVRLSETLTQALEPLPASSATTQETAMGNLLADAVLAKAKADVALVDSGLIDKNGLAPGPVRVGDLYRLLGSYTRQHIVTVRAPGALVQETLYRVSRDRDKLPFHLAGAVVGDNAVTVGGKALESEKSYTVAAPAHVIQATFYGKPGVLVVSDDVLAPTIRDNAIDFLRGHAPLKNQRTPRWQNRTGS